MSSRLMVNLILNLNIRVKRVADTKKSEIKLEHKGQVGGRHQNKPTRERPKVLGRFYVNDYSDVLLTNKMYNARITVILMKG